MKLANYINFFSFLWIFIATNACNTIDKKDPVQLAAYIEKESHELKKTIEVEDKKVQLSYRPTILLVQQELKGITKPTNKQLEEAKQKYSPYYYFILSIKAGDKDALYGGSVNFQQFSENLQKLSFQMNEFVYALSGNDTVPLTDFFTPNMFGYGKQTEVLLVFERNKIKDNQLIINLEELGLGLGRQSFEFEKEKLEDIDN